MTVIMGYHGPETPNRLGRHRYAELRDIAFEKRPDEVVAPDQARGVVVGQERTWKSTPQPQLVLFLDARLVERET